MAKRQDLISALESLGIPCYYGQSKATPISEMPTVSYRMVNDYADYSDNASWSRSYRYDIELDEASKDFALEQSLCDALLAKRIEFSRFETEHGDWIQTTFEITLEN